MSYLNKIFKAIATLALLVVIPQAMAQTPKHDQAQLECVAQTIYFEARGEPLNGQVAVANVIMNRVKQGYAKTPCEVIAMKHQFSWIHHHPKIVYQDLYEKNKQVARSVYYGHVGDNINGAIFYHANYVNPHWKYKRVVTIGHHIFYKIA